MCSYCMKSWRYVFYRQKSDLTFAYLCFVLEDKTQNARKRQKYKPVCWEQLFLCALPCFSVLFIMHNVKLSVYVHKYVYIKQCFITQLLGNITTRWHLGDSFTHWEYGWFHCCSSPASGNVTQISKSYLSEYVLLCI